MGRRACRMKLLHIRIPSGLYDQARGLVPEMYSSLSEMIRASIKGTILFEERWKEAEKIRKEKLTDVIRK